MKNESDIFKKNDNCSIQKNNAKNDIKRNTQVLISLN